MKNKWIYIILNFWAVLSIVMMMAIILVLSFEDPKPLSIKAMFMYMGIIISGLICGKNVIDLLFVYNGNGSETIININNDKIMKEKIENELNINIDKNKKE
jgi:hypothetical protein